MVTISPGPYLTEWVADVPALLDMGLPGEQEGPGLVDVLFGDVEVSGKLPHTMPNKWNEVGMTQKQYPGLPPDNTTGPPCVDRPAEWSSGKALDPHGIQCSPTKAYYR